MRDQMTISKIQIPNKTQFSNSNDRNKSAKGRVNRLEFGYLLLKIYLGFGAWSLVLLFDLVLRISNLSH
jgi:hypothetical protein